MQLRRYIEAQSQYSQEHLTVDQKIDAALPRLFDFDFPIFDEDYRATLERNIVKRYYMREIGFETMALFKFYLNQWLNLNMPYYNQLYKSMRIEFDPMENVNYKDVRNKVNSGTKNTKSNATSDTDRDYTSDVTGTSNTDTKESSENNSRTIGDDTPQARLDNTTKYNSNVNTTNSNGEDDTTETQDTTSKQTDSTKTNFTQDTTNDQEHRDNEDYTFSRQGKMSSVTYSELLMKYRETFINVDKQIIDAMNVLFMGIW
jgi:hypothetical protein